MLIFLAHGLGDFPLQSHLMAIEKTTSWRWALLHAAVYTLPFLALTREPGPLVVICISHAIIDHDGLARRWCRLYGVGHPGLWWRIFRRGQAFVEPPAHIRDWLTIIVDQLMHLAIAAAVLPAWR